MFKCFVLQPSFYSNSTLLKSDKVLTVSHILHFTHIKDSFDFFCHFMYIYFVYTIKKVWFHARWSGTMRFYEIELSQNLATTTKLATASYSILYYKKYICIFCYVYVHFETYIYVCMLLHGIHKVISVQCALAMDTPTLFYIRCIWYTVSKNIFQCN